MIEPGGKAGFLFESMQTLAVGRECSGQQLDGHFAAQPRVERQVDFAHSSFTEHFLELVMVDLPRNGKIILYRFKGELPRGYFEGWSFDETLGLGIVCQ